MRARQAERRNGKAAARKRKAANRKSESRAERKEAERQRKQKQPMGEALHTGERKHQRLSSSRGSGKGQHDGAKGVADGPGRGRGRQNQSGSRVDAPDGLYVLWRTTCSAST